MTSVMGGFLLGDPIALTSKLAVEITSAVGYIGASSTSALASEKIERARMGDFCRRLGRRTDNSSGSIASRALRSKFVNLSSRYFLVATLMLLLSPLGCAEPQAVSDAEMTEIDTHTMSVRLDRNDVERIYAENIEKLVESPAFGAWEGQAAAGASVSVATYPIRNETDQEVDSALQALLSKFEQALVGRDVVDVISHENQPDLIAEAELQQSEAYDSERAAAVGKQIGAQFFVTGKFYGDEEVVEDTERMQYFVNLQVIDIESGQVVFQNTSAVEPTKGKF